MVVEDKDNQRLNVPKRKVTETLGTEGVVGKRVTEPSQEVTESRVRTLSDLTRRTAVRTGRK